MITKIKPITEEATYRIEDKIDQKVKGLDFREWQVKSNELVYNWKEKGLLIHLRNETTSYNTTDIAGFPDTDYNWRYVLSVRRGNEELYHREETRGAWEGLKDLYHRISSQIEESKQKEQQAREEKREVDKQKGQERIRQRGLRTLRNILDE